MGTGPWTYIVSPLAGLGAYRGGLPPTACYDSIATFCLYKDKRSAKGTVDESIDQRNARL